MTLRIDLETYSSEDLSKCGVHRYAQSPDFAILLFGYAFDAEPVQVADLASGQAVPARVLSALFDAKVVKAAFNASFEIVCLNAWLAKQGQARRLDAAQWQCTSVHALYLGLPGSLADVGQVVGLPLDKQKMSAGWQLIRYFCMPCRPSKANGGRTRNLPQHDPQKWQLFKEYCQRDVQAERDISARLARFAVPASEQRLWVLDQKMNARGMTVDRELVQAAMACDSEHRMALMDEAQALTGLDNPNSRDQLLAWLQSAQDESIDTLTKKTVPALLALTDSQTVRRVLEIRQELSKTSVSKYQAMARAMCQDDRLRGLLQFYGANRTGRWAGRLVQVQNLPQNKLRDLDLAREMVKAGRHAELEMLFGNVLDTLSQLVRTAFVAQTGHRLIVVDFSAIEARVIAWLANSKWRLEVFATHGKIYEASAEQMFGLPAGSVTKKSPYRQKGKVSELALGYGGGAGALRVMGALEMGLQESELEGIKHAWRQANPEIVRFWYSVEACAKEAVIEKKAVTLPIAGGRAKLVFRGEAGFLTIELPGGRKLFYVKPRVEAEDLQRQVGQGDSYTVASMGAVTFEGIDQKTRKWTRIAGWGGKWVENITQAIARDCLKEAMLQLDAKGYCQLTTVHDEIVMEAANGWGSVADIQTLMARPIAWAPGLALRADGFETRYYMKEID